MVDSNRSFIPQPLSVCIGIILELLESDSVNIKERLMMVVNEQQTINERCNIISRGNQKDIHQGLEWWNRCYKPI